MNPAPKNRILAALFMGSTLLAARAQTSQLQGTIPQHEQNLAEARSSANYRNQSRRAEYARQPLPASGKYAEGAR